jgi:hypothetical protein|tara:strand:+ start:169 stop:579 length:411 start_codon:yes stop_codon:yes gene_type:complete
MPRKVSRKNLIKKLDNLFSLYTRLKYADKNGIVTCYTCGIQKHYKDYMQNGHFISRRHYILRWSEKNTRVQCYSCNVGNQGRQYEFSVKLNKEYGYDIASELLQESKKIKKFSNDELISLINRYKEFIKVMEKSLI